MLTESGIDQYLYDPSEFYAWDQKARRQTEFRSNDVEIQPGLFEHFVPPLDLKRGGADDQDPAGTIAQHQLADD